MAITCLRRWRALTSATVLVALSSCGNPDAGDDDPGQGTPDASTPGSGVDARPNAMFVGTCADPPPSGAVVAPPLPAYSGGSCPAIVPGRNTIMSSGAARQFILIAPEDLQSSEELPVLTIWHHLGGDADGIVEKGQVQDAANRLRVLAVVPEKKGDVTIPFVDKDMVWPYLSFVTDARIEEEMRFFDDMMACVAEAYPVDENCLSSVGVSAGALWTSILIQRRSERLANAIVLSGGVGPALDLGGVADILPWNGATRPLPVLVLWGGASDQCVVDFERASHNLETGLMSGGHFMVECVHNCGHAVPPVDPTQGLASIYQFALDHPYWLSAGASPYLAGGMPSSSPDWCATGAGSAVARTGECLETSVDSGCPALP